jgi:hypothetical protein
MQFTAQIKLTSHIHQRWRVRDQIGGEVSGVSFHLVGGKYVTNLLTEEQVNVLRPNPAVQLEVMSVAPTVLTFLPIQIPHSDPAKPEAIQPLPKRLGRPPKRGYGT